MESVVDVVDNRLPGATQCSKNVASQDPLDEHDIGFLQLGVQADEAARPTTLPYEDVFELEPRLLEGRDVLK
jgi:hypothetical protein